MSWTDGYISDIRYPAFFYKEMQPVWLSAVAGLTGFAAPDVATPFILCELGCGIGINLLVSAACHPHAHFVGVDFNADHLTMARDAASSAGLTNIAFVEADFAAFAAQNDHMFDFVTSHGTWSWIAPEQQAALLETVSRSLKPGGLFSLHYMCHPGSTDLLSFQHLLNLCAHHMPGPSPRKAEVGLKLLQQMAATGLFAHRPDMLRHLENMARRDTADLAHEFLTDHWRPDHSVDLHQRVARSGPTYIASADMFNNLDLALSVPGNMQALIRQTRVPALAETMKDMARNARQRMDLFQKQPRPLDEAAFLAQVKASRFGLLSHGGHKGAVSFETPIGRITGPEEIFAPLLQRLTEGTATGAQLLDLPPFAGDTPALLQAIQLLMMQGMAHPVLPTGQTGGPADDRVDRLSRWLERHAVALEIVAPCGTAIPSA